MGVNNTLYDRPDLDQRWERAPALYVTGSLQTAWPSVAYEGRLPIHNAVGDCWAELINGDVPGGTVVYADNATNEVVIAWPDYGNLDELVNANIQSGDLNGWDVETIGGSGTLTAGTAHTTSGAYAAYWAGGRGMGNEGGIECLAINQTRSPAYPTQRISGAVDIGYNFAGGTPKGSRGQARICWYNAQDQRIGQTEGDLIYTRRYNHTWTASNVSGQAPDGTAYARFAAWVTATGSGHAWFDTARWDATTFVGTDQNTPVCITVRVHDAAGRTADWSGCVPFGLVPPLGDWRYKQVSWTDDTDYSQPSFDDSSWSVGTAPFGDKRSGYQGATAFDDRFSSTATTDWATTTHIWIRQKLTLAEVPANGIQLTFFMDDHFKLYVNGVNIYTRGSEYGGGGGTVTITQDNLVVGENTIAFEGWDETSSPDAGNKFRYIDAIIETA